MAFRLADAFVELSVRGLGPVQTGLLQLQKSVANIGTAFGRLRTLAIGAFAGVSIAGAVKSIVNATLEEEKAQSELRAALAATGQEVEKNTSRITAFAEAIQRATALDDELIVSLAAQATALGVSADKLEKTIELALGLSRAFNIEPPQAMKAAIFALEGQFKKLSREIPQLKNLDPNKAMQVVLERGAIGMRILREESNSLGGQIKQLRNEFENLQESLEAEGIIGGLVAALRSVVGFLQENLATFKQWGSSIGNIADAVFGHIGELLTALTGQSQVAWENIRNAITVGFLRLEVVFENLGTAWRRVTLGFLSDWLVFKENFSLGLDLMLEATKATFKGIGSVVSEFVDAAIPILLNFFTGQWAEAGRLGGKLGERLNDAFAKPFEAAAVNVGAEQAKRRAEIEKALEAVRKEMAGLDKVLADKFQQKVDAIAAAALRQAPNAPGVPGLKIPDLTKTAKEAAEKRPELVGIAEFSRRIQVAAASGDKDKVAKEQLAVAEKQLKELQGIAAKIVPVAAGIGIIGP